MEENILRARIEDALNIAERSGTPHFVGFLNEQECAVATLVSGNRRFALYGGYGEAERKIFAALPDWCDDDFCTFPITPCTLTYRKEAPLTHRDFLGTLMSLGITRECVGDILVEKGRTVVFLSTDICPFVTANLEKVGGEGIILKRGYTEPLPGHGTLADFSDTVSSLRLDCVVCALASLSRNGATELIEKGSVSINGITCDKITKTVAQNEKLTIRGKGKFIISGVGRHSKKGRVIIEYKKYT